MGSQHFYVGSVLGVLDSAPDEFVVLVIYRILQNIHYFETICKVVNCIEETLYRTYMIQTCSKACAFLLNEKYARA